MSEKTSTALAVPRTGVGYLTLVDGVQPTKEKGQLIAAWETPEKTVLTKAPKRVVIRTDGILTDQGTAGGIPCGVLAVRYTIGGLKRNVLVDALKQNALVVWAESVDVEPVFDARRIERLSRYSVDPCPKQQVAAAITSGAGHGDSGAADARWLDVLALDATEPESNNEWSIHPIPDGARGVRFLNALVSGANYETADKATFIVFSACSFPVYPTGLVETVINGLTDQSIILVPAGASWLFVQFPAGTFAGFDEPPFIEWILAPSTPVGF